LVLKVWLSADGFRDTDDNVAQMVGAALGVVVSANDPGVELAGMVFGDTVDGGQFHMLKPSGRTPDFIDDNPRYDQVGKSKQAAGNHEFFDDYAAPAFRSLGIASYDMLATDNGGMRAWNFDATSKSQLAPASRDLADDILEAMATRDDKVVYSAGGGANVAAEAIGYLLESGYTKAEIVPHFAVIQHGKHNWVRQYEPEARDLTREFTIAITNQDEKRYANGWDGPYLRDTIHNRKEIDGSEFGDAFDLALDVAIGNRKFDADKLAKDAIFRPDFDGSDVGSHAFAFDEDALSAAWTKRMRPGENLSEARDEAHMIDAPGNQADRARVLYNSFTHRDVSDLFDGDAGLPDGFLF
jgi:hypothetical protein